MITKIIKMDEKISEKAIQEAGEIIRAGGLVAFPTETVYGLGGDALNPESSKKIYTAKGRPSDNPLIVHICNMESLSKIVTEIPESAHKLSEAFWPGPLTMIFHKSEAVPYETTGGLPTVAVRMPDHPVALALIEASGGYIAAPSANRSKRPSPTLASHVKEDMDGMIEMIIDGGEVGIGLESTIVDLTSEIPVILRPGYITQDMLEKILGEVAVDRTILDDSCTEAPKAPGMKYKHYAPKGELTIVEGEEDAVAELINSKIEELGRQGKKTGVIATEETMGRYRAVLVKNVGSRQNEASIARALYRILRDFDTEGTEVIFSEAFPTSGMGQAIMNRLLKAAGHKIIHA